MYITKNGTNDLVVLSDEAYEELLKVTKETEEERIDRLVTEYFSKQYASFEEFKKDVFKKIDQDFIDIVQGCYSTMEKAARELEKKYGLSES